MLAGAWAARALGCDREQKVRMLAESSAPELLYRAAGATESIRFSAEQLVCCLFLICFLKLNKESRPRDSAPKPGRTQVSTDIFFIYDAIFIFVWTWTFESVEENFKYEME